ncbi:hypothetical protein O0L34_g6736 [Tuta absoluta]|nr:hypothetical protein O0L34_g6736 [Tuta absoluta]
MGGAVSSGRNNTELIDNLMGGNYIRSRDVERAFRALDRGDYMTPEARDQAYKDLAWRNGPLHMSAPCIYSEVMEGLELRPGLSFLNIGSGTGYLSTLVGMILGSNGVNHGVEVHPLVVDYANMKLVHFLEDSPAMDEFDFCEPKFLCGNGLCLAPLQTQYDRVYCGAGCPAQYQNYFQQLIKVGGILIMPLNDNLLQVKRTGPTEWVTRSLLNVSFATLRVPTKEEQGAVFRLEEQTPARLQALARSVIRECMRGAMRRRNPHVREPPPKAPPAKRACPRRICIPVDEDSDDELNELHDLDRASGANEMNALLSLVLSMGHNRVAGALRVDPRDSDSESSSEASSSSYDPNEDQHHAAGDVDRASPTLRIVNVNERPHSDADGDARPTVRSVLMFEFRDRNGVLRHNAPLALQQQRRRRRRQRQHRRARYMQREVSVHAGAATQRAGSGSTAARATCRER